MRINSIFEVECIFNKCSLKVIIIHSLRPAPSCGDLCVLTQSAAPQKYKANRKSFLKELQPWLTDSLRLKF